MTAKVLKFWHQWSWLITCGGYLFLLGLTWQAHKDAIASTQSAVISIEVLHDKENLDQRVTRLEQIASDNRDNFSDIKDTEKAIFQRINQMTDKR